MGLKGPLMLGTLAQTQRVVELGAVALPNLCPLLRRLPFGCSPRSVRCVNMGLSKKHIQALFHLSSTLTLDTSLLSFTLLSLMIGLQLWLPTLMLFQTSTPIVGPGSLVICASSSHLMRPMKSTKRLQGMTPTLLKSWRATRQKLLQQWTKIRHYNCSQFHHSLSLS